MARDNDLLASAMKSVGTHADEAVSQNDLKKLLKNEVRKIMNGKVKALEKDIKSNMILGKMGEVSNIVDYIMYLSIVIALAFGYVAYKKLSDQKDMLVIWDV